MYWWKCVVATCIIVIIVVFDNRFLIVPEMTYNVSSGTLNTTHSLTSLHIYSMKKSCFAIFQLLAL